MKFSVLCLKPLSLSHSQWERERERETLTHKHSHRHSITHARSHTPHVTGLQWPWIFQTRHSFPSIRNNGVLTHMCTHTQIHTHTQSSTHTAPPQQRRTQSHTSWPFNNEREGDEGGVREMERVKTQDERGKDSIGAAMRLSTRTPPPIADSL